MTQPSTPPMLIAVPIHTPDGVRHVTGQIIDQTGLLAVHPELSVSGFTGGWQITNVVTGESMTRAESSAWLVTRELAGGRR